MKNIYAAPASTMLNLEPEAMLAASLKTSTSVITSQEEILSNEKEDWQTDIDAWDDFDE